MRDLASVLLVCVPLLGAASSAAAAPDPGVSVVGVGPRDVLNLRAQPDARSALVGSLPHNARDLVVVAQATETLDWVMVQKGRMRGWANARFLAYGDPLQQHRLPLRLHCAGTEPFWGIEVGYGRADAHLAFDDRHQRLALETPMPAAARPTLWLLPGRGPRDAATFLLLERRVCSDGMSDARYAFSVAARLGDVLLSGCCR